MMKGAHLDCEGDFGSVDGRAICVAASSHRSPCRTSTRTKYIPVEIPFETIRCEMPWQAITSGAITREEVALSSSLVPGGSLAIKRTRFASIAARPCMTSPLGPNTAPGRSGSKLQCLLQSNGVGLDMT
jgi:hypothetical protein